MPLPPAYYYWEMPVNSSSITSPPGNGLLDNITSPDGPSCPVAMSGTIPRQQPSSGNVTIRPDGSYTFTAAPGWSGERGALEGGPLCARRDGLRPALHTLGAKPAP